MAGEAAPVTIAYYYQTRWGAHDEFVGLFDGNHWPILREQLAAGRFLDVTASRPRFHGDGRADWDFMVTITYRDWAAVEEHSDAVIARRLFPDQDRPSTPRNVTASRSSRPTGTSSWSRTGCPRRRREPQSRSR